MEDPRRTSLVPLAFPCFVLRLIGVEAEGLLDYQGRAGDHFHCTVEPLPDHIRFRHLEICSKWQKCQASAPDGRNARQLSGSVSCDSDVDSNRAMPTAKSCETKACVFPHLLLVGSQESVLKVPKPGQLHAVIRVTPKRYDSCAQGALGDGRTVSRRNFCDAELLAKRYSETCHQARQREVLKFSPARKYQPFVCSRCDAGKFQENGCGRFWGVHSSVRLIMDKMSLIMGKTTRKTQASRLSAVYMGVPLASASG